MKAPKAPKPTAQQLAVERRQAAALDEEIREQEERFKAMARGKLGAKSLLGGVPHLAIYNLPHLAEICRLKLI